MKHLFIVNPVAGGKDKTEAVRAAVQKVMADSRDTWEIYVTRAPMDALDKVQREAATGVPLRVYACGGDGTLNECVGGAAGLAHVAVAPYPCGTGNDFIKMFGEDRDAFFDLSRLVAGEVHPLDLIRCNGRWSVNICSVGVDARIGTEVHKYSKLPVIGGKGGYIVSAIVNLFKGINRNFTILVDGEELHSGPTALVCVCNGQWYGGSFHAMPLARPDDGILDCLLVPGVSRLNFIRFITGYAKGRFANYPKYIRHVRGKKLEVTAGGEDIAVNLDGELLRGNHICMELFPGEVNFLFPAGMRYSFIGKKKTEAI